jgi:NO-binding membrane sensor protein with MHYT domain
MHFIGNKAIVMADGRKDLQLTYSAGYTVLSAIIPILGLYLGFSIVDWFGKSKRYLHPSLLVTGFIAGLSILAMHYVGNKGTSDYYLEHKIGTILGSAAIAIFDCWFAFTIFFILKELWIDHWWLRMVCAAILAGAVSGMHWTAAIGTSYRLRTLKPHNTDAPDSSVILASVLCIIALLTCAALLYLTNAHQRKLAKRAHQLVIAALVRDEEGKVLVTQEGLLPCRTIEYSLGNELDKSHPAFHWMYRISHNWSSISMLIPKMKEYLKSEDFLSKVTSSNTNSNKANLDQPVFRAQFCVAAQELADDLGIRLQDLGVLHTELMTTGTETNGGSRARSVAGNSKLQDLESVESLEPMQKGQTLFVTRNVDMKGAQSLITQGFRFAALDNSSGNPTRVAEMMATKMQTHRMELLATTRVKKPAAETILPPSLVPKLVANAQYVSLFALRPRFGSSNCPWDIMVYNSELSKIPTVACETGKGPSGDLRHSLRDLESRTPDEICALLNVAKHGQSSKNDKEVAKWMTTSIRTLSDHIPRPIFHDAVFCPTPVSIPVDGPTHLERETATIWPFVVILDVHNQCHFSHDDKIWSWIPYNFFQCLQASRPGSPDQTILAQKNYIEFNSLFSQAARPPTTSSPGKVPRLDRVYNKLTRVPTGTSVGVPLSRSQTVGEHPDNSSEKGLVHISTREYDVFPPSLQPLSFGGILVSEEVVQSDAYVNPDIEMHDLGVRSTAGAAKEEQSTWVDDLYAASVQQWLSRGGRENLRAG